MVLFPNCKINLGLRVAARRDDGYHDLETIFYPLNLRDAAEIITYTARKEAEPFELTITGESVPGDPQTNLCRKAWQLVKHDFPNIPPIRMYLHKAVPIGAGLGGGSADGAFTLRLLNDALKLNISTDKLLSYALQLGSDCPFFILNKPVHARGRGEIMEEVTVDLSDYYFVLIFPGIHVNTGEVFKELHELRKSDRQDAATGALPSLKQMITLPVTSWRDTLTNDFELPVFKRFPEIKKIKDLLYDAGAAYASMTGTGSSVYGIFHKNKKTGNLKAAENYKVYILNKSH